MLLQFLANYNLVIDHIINIIVSVTFLFGVIAISPELNNSWSSCYCARLQPRWSDEGQTVRATGLKLLIRSFQQFLFMSFFGGRLLLLKRKADSFDFVLDLVPLERKDNSRVRTELNGQGSTPLLLLERKRKAHDNFDFVPDLVPDLVPLERKECFCVGTK